MDIFQSAGIQVKTIYSGESSLISLVNMTVAKQYRTFVVLIADPITLTTLLWVDGSFYYFNSTRCFHEQGTEEYAMDVARSVSQIIQFMQAHQIEHELEVIQIAGIVGNDIRLYQMALNGQGISVPSQAFDSSALSAGNGDVQGYLHAASGLVSNGKWHNILNQLGGKKRKKDNAAGSGKGFLIIGITFAVAVLATLGCFFYKLMKQQELDALEDEINNPTVLAQLDEYDTLVVRNSFLTSQYNAIADIDENLYTYPVCDDDILKVFTKCAGSLATVQFESFDANSGIVSITAKSDTVDNINVFIRALCNEDIFKTVDYTGYSYDSQTELWNINVTCTLTESAGR
jgi:hypothetical protein